MSRHNRFGQKPKSPHMIPHDEEKGLLAEWREAGYSEEEIFKFSDILLEQEMKAVKPGDVIYRVRLINPQDKNLPQ